MRPRRFLRIAWSVAAAAALAGCASAEPRPRDHVAAPSALLGPMVGHVTDRSATFWIRTDRPGRLRAVVRGPDGEEADAETDLARGDGSTGTITVGGLDPDRRYVARFTLDGAPIEVGGDTSFRTFPEPGETTRLRIALVSCARVRWDSVQSIWTRIEADDPDVVLWLGDNNYFEHRGDSLPADWEDPERMAFKYAELRGLPALRPLLRSAVHYAIWDDHDYADGTPDRRFPLKDEIARLFERFWANPSYGGPGVDGIYSRVRAGDVEIFLLDDRYWRDPEDAPDGPGKTMLGIEQRRWLIEGLAGSDARLKIVAVGVQFLADYHEYDGFQHYAWERDRILDQVAEHEIDGVVFVTGDRHLSELMRFVPPGGYPLYELTASPVANRPFVNGLEQPNPIRLGGYAAGFNYGLLDVDTAGEGRLVFRLKDDRGREVLTHEVPLAALRFPKKGALTP